ncbi:S8 family serine peptidase [Pseudomonas sp. nanlin1]|uniref:S8 family serine peptidase n=1 Tax=Pseudomonas sp. nanlin1 TaxID=3040605 RepID=UPI0038908EF8
MIYHSLLEAPFIPFQDEGNSFVELSNSGSVDIATDPSPTPKPVISDEDQARDDVSNGFVINKATHKIAFSDDTLNKTDFFSVQTGSLATGGLRPGETQLDRNVRPTEHLSQFYLDKPDGQADFSLRNAVLLNGLSVQATNNVFIDPLLLNVTGPGVQMTAIGNGVLFDTDNSGTLKRTGWADATTGILVVDDGSGQITGVRQLFSEYYAGAMGKDGAAGERRFANGFAALASEDTSKDGLITAADPIWSQLRVWIDVSQDGQSQAGELRTLESLGITQFNLAFEPVSGDIRQGNTVLGRGSFVMNGESREALAVDFLADPVGSTVERLEAGIQLSSTGEGVTATAYAASGPADAVLDAQALKVQNLYGGEGNDTLTAAPSGSWLVGGGGRNKYIGGAGNDVFVISASDSPADIQGNGGRDSALIVGHEGVSLNLAKAGLAMAQGGRGRDYLVSGGKDGVFMKGGSGGAVLVGGAGNDVLVGGSGSNMIVGGTGKAVIYAGPSGDRILASARGSIIFAGGGADVIQGRDGDDVIEVGKGAASIDGGGGTNVVTLHGSHGEYTISATAEGYTVADQVSGRDGAVTLRKIQKLNFSDISAVTLGGPNAMPVADVLRANAGGTPIERGHAQVIAAAALLANDQAMGSTGPLKLASVSDALGGTAVLDAQGDVLFTPDPAGTGIMSFKYTVVDQAGNPAMSIVNLDNAELAPMRATASLLTAEVPTDPLAARQWYLNDIDVLPVWQDYSGSGVRIGQFEPGGEFSVGPEVFDYQHPDLLANVDPAWLKTQQQAGTLPDTFSNHATQVAGVMVAARNEVGGVGVAPKATLGGHYLANKGADLSGFGHVVNYDVANHSWSFSNDFALSNHTGSSVTTASALMTAAQYAAANGRGGLGTVSVTSGGNQRAKGGSTQGSLTNNHRYAIQVGAINAKGDLSTLQIGSAPFSNPGSSLLLSAPGSNVLSSSRQLQTERGSIFGSDYSTQQGTSFAAPIVSGVVALMLEANPALGYRDVQEILALSARKVSDSASVWRDNHAQHWNGGAMHVSDDYGFGAVDARAAVRLAESWSVGKTAANEASVGAASAPLAQAVAAATTVDAKLTLAEGVAIEHVEVDLVADVGRLGDLTVALIAPDGTRSELLARPGKAPGSADTDMGSPYSGAFNYTFMSTQHWGERSQGDWTLQVSNVATGLPVNLQRWALRAFGAPASADDRYVFTDEFAALAAAQPQRALINDALKGTPGGKDTLNAAAMRSDVGVDLREGKATLGATALSLVSAKSIANVLTGDGNDTLIAADQPTSLYAGRGQNRLVGGTAKDFFAVRQRAGGSDTVEQFDASAGEVIGLVGFHGKSFADLKLTQQAANVHVELPAGQSLIVAGQTVAKMGAAQFAFSRHIDAPAGYFEGAAPPAPIAPGTVTLNGGAQGISLVSSPQGGMIGALTGTVYQRDGIEANRFVVTKQEGVLDYKNALRGFRPGLDKIDLSQTTVTGFSDLSLTKAQRAVINGVATIHGASIHTVGTADSPGVNLLYIDTLDVAQLSAADFIFATAAVAQPAPVASEPGGTIVPPPVATGVPTPLPSAEPLLQAMAGFNPQGPAPLNFRTADPSLHSPMLAVSAA